jgi:hypothetical protein
MWFGVGDGSAHALLPMKIKTQHTNAIRRITAAFFTDPAPVSRE